MTSIASMALLNRQDGPIALYGATGYTGRLVAAELAAAKADFVLSGRNRGKLDSLAEELGGNSAVQPAALDDEGALRSLLSDCAAVIDCAGPFIRHGEPVLRAAVETETHYLDTTGEQAYMRMAFDRYGPEAEAAGVAVIPAMGFDYVPGDMLASLTARGMGELDEIALSYAWVGFQPSHGTARSALEVLSGEDVEWTNLKWQPASGGIGRGSFDFPEPIGRQRVIRYPSGEQITVPRHVATRNVRTTMNAAAFAPPGMAAGVQLLGRPLGLALRTPLKRLLSTAISRLPEGPTPDQRAAMRFTIVCDATRGEKRSRGVISGRDVYGLTAAAVSKGALIAAGRGFSAGGALAPSQAFDPEDFLGALDEFELRWQVDRPQEPAAAPMTAK
jgi:short subunit dehydrogenase-like uncharacterized protein